MEHPTDDTTHKLQSQRMDVTSQLKDVEDVVVPVLKEELEVHKELRKTGTVRILKTVRELEEAVHESLLSEAVDIQRVPMDQIVDSPPQIRTEGEVTVIPVFKEELLITKQLRLVEELRITKRQSVSDYRENVKVLAEEVAIERVHSGVPEQTMEKAQNK